MGDSSNLDRLIKESEEAIQRLDEIQRKKHNLPLFQRISQHFNKNSPYLLNVLLAGSVLTVALGRLTQKQIHEAEREKWEAAQQRLEAQKAAAEQKAQALSSSTEALVAALEQAVEGKGRRDLPALVRQQLADWRQRVGGLGGGSADATAAAAAAGPGTSPDAGSSSSSSSGGGGGKIMI